MLDEQLDDVEVPECRGKPKRGDSLEGCPVGARGVVAGRLVHANALRGEQQLD